MMNYFSNIEFGFDIATFITILASICIFLYQMANRRKREAADRFSEQARSVVLRQVNNATERLAQLDFHTRISRRDAWQSWARKMNTKPYILEVEYQENEWHSDPDVEMPRRSPTPLRCLEVRQLQRFTEVINILDPLVLSFQNFSNEINIQSWTVAPLLKPTITGAASNQMLLNELFEELGKEMEQLYSELKDGVSFMQNVDIALNCSHRALTVSSAPVTNDWTTLRTHLKQSLTENDFRFAAYCIPTELKMPFDKCDCAADRTEHEREVLNEFSIFLAKDPEAYIRACLPTILEFSKSYENISSRLLLILSCTTDRLVSETGLSAAERYQERELLLPNKSKASDGSITPV